MASAGGPDSFHGLLLDDSSAALVLATLRRSQGMDLEVANAFRDVDAAGAGAGAGCGTRLQLTMRQLNLLLMQQMYLCWM